MHPTIFGLNAYATATVVGIALAVLVACVRAGRLGVPVSRFVAFEIVVAVVSYLGAKAYPHVVHHGSLSDLANLLRPGDARYPGGIVAALLVTPVAWRLLLRGTSVGLIADVVAPSVGVALGTVRVGCLLAGCCYGIVSHSPWAISFPAGSPAWNDHVASGLARMTDSHSLPVEPLQIFFGLSSFAAALVAICWRRHARYAGESALLFLVMHEGAKAGLELLRQGEAARATWHLPIASAIIAVVAAMSLLAGRRRLRSPVVGEPATV